MMYTDVHTRHTCELDEGVLEVSGQRHRGPLIHRELRELLLSPRGACEDGRYVVLRRGQGTMLPLVHFFLLVLLVPVLPVEKKRIICSKRMRDE